MSAYEAVFEYRVRCNVFCLKILLLQVVCLATWMITSTSPLWVERVDFSRIFPFLSPESFNLTCCLGWAFRHFVAQKLSSRAEVVYIKNRIALSDLRIPERWPLPPWFLLMLTYADQATTPNATWIYIFYSNPCTSCTAGVQVGCHASPSPAPGGCVVEWCQSLNWKIHWLQVHCCDCCAFPASPGQEVLQKQGMVGGSLKIGLLCLVKLHRFWMPVMPVMPVMSLSNLSPGCFPTRLSFALTGIASAVGTQGGKGLDLKGAKAGTAKLQLSATGCNHQNAGTSFHQFSVFFFCLSTCWCRISGLGHGGKLVNGRALEIRRFSVCRQGQQSPVNPDRLCGTSTCNLHKRRGEKTGQLEVVDFITVGAKYRTCSVLQPWQKWTVFNRWSV